MYRDLLYVLHQSIVTPFLQLLQCKAYKARKWRQTRPGNDVKLSARVLVFCGSQSSGWRKQTWSRKCKMVDATIHSWTRTARLRNRNSRSLSVPLNSFHLQALQVCSVNIDTTEVLYHFDFELLPLAGFAGLFCQHWCNRSTLSLRV